MKRVTKKTRGVEAILKPYNEDVKRHMSVLSEEFQGRVSAIAEQFDGLNKKLDSHAEVVGKLAVDMEIVKTNSEFMKDGLKKKVDYD